MMNNDMNTSTRKKVNKEWGIEEERYARTAPGFTKRKLRKRDTLPIIFVIAMLVLIAVGGWNMHAKAANYSVTFVENIPVNAGEVNVTNMPATNPQSVDTEENDSAIIAAPGDPELVGYVFGGWFKEPECRNAWDFNIDEVSGNISLYAKWQPETHNVSFNNNGVTPSSFPSNLVGVLHGDKISAPSVPVASGYAFSGWYKDADCLNAWNFSTDCVTSDTILYAKWLKTPEISIVGWTYGDTANSPVVRGSGGVPYDGSTPVFTYYSNSSCTIETTPASDGADSNGGVPQNVGTYYVKTTVTETEVFAGATISASFTISKRTLTVDSGITVGDKTYDGNRNATSVNCDSVVLIGVANRDCVDPSVGYGFDPVKIGITATGVFPNKNTSSVNVDVALSGWTPTGTSALNYEIASSGNQSTASAKIIPKEVTVVSGITAQDKAYDGNTTATLNCGTANISGKITGDDLSVTATGTFDSANVGTGKTVTISDLELTGADAGNYELAATGQQTSTTAMIYSSGVQPDVTISGEYTYRGSAITPTYTVKIGDTVLRPGTDYTAELSDNVNAGVDTATLTIKAVSGGMYRFADKEVHFTINKAPATLASVTLGTSLTYNGSQQPQTVNSVSVCGSSLPSNKWSVHETTNQAKDAGNHNLVIDIEETENVAAGSVTKVFTIAPKDVTVSGITVDPKPYDGTTEAMLNYSGASFSGIQDGDTLSVASAVGTYTSKNAGTGISVSISNITLGGSSAANYRVSSASQRTTTGSITAIETTPTVSVSGTYVYTGKAIKPSDLTVTVSGQTLEKTDYSITGYEDNVNAGTATVYVSSKARGNYSFSSVGGNFTIEPATSLSPSPKTTLTLKSSAAATKVGDIAVSSLGVNSSKWAWRSSDEGISLVYEAAATTAATTGTASTATGTASTTAKAATQPVTVRATLEYIGDDADNYVASVKSVVVTITKEGSTGTAVKSTTGTGSTSTRSTTGTGSTGTRSSSTGTSTRSSTTSSRSSSSSGSTSTRTGSSSSSGSTSTRSGSSSRTTSGSSASSGSSSASEAKPPFIEGAPDLSGWEAIQLRIDGTAIGDSIPVYMNGSSKVPSDVLNSFKGRNVTLVLDMGNSIKWNINGACISQDVPNDIDFDIATNTKAIPTELVDMVSATDYKMQLHLEHNGDFLVAPILTLNLGANNAGLYANLFYYNESASALEYVTADQISEDGTASLTFTHASDYVVIVDKEILANVAVHLDKPETTTIEDNTEKADTAPISDIADPNSMQAYVQTQPMEETHVPRSAAVERRIVAPEAKKGLRVFWILLILIAALVGVNTYLFMNREELKAAASSRASKKALSKSSSKAAVSSGQKNLKKIQKANNKKFKKYL